MLSQIININETLKELEHLGLVIDDKNTFEYYVKNFNINTFIHEYSDYFLNENGRYENTKSSELIEFYTFDKNLGIHLFKNILIIEKIINTNLAYILINQFNIKDKCLLRLDKYFIKEKVLPNVSTIEPQISFEILLIKMVKYLGANKNYRKFQDHSTGDPILQWKDCPLDIMCLTWSFATTFSIMIASNVETREMILKNFGINYDMIDGFMDFIKNTIHIRNLISHNISLYNGKIKYQSEQINNLYFVIFNEKVEEIKLIHMIRLFGFFSNDPTVYEKTMKNLNNLNFSGKTKEKLLELFRL